MADNANDDIKARMAEALKRKQQGHDSVAEGHHHKENGPSARGPQGGGSMFRRRAGGGG